MPYRNKKKKKRKVMKEFAIDEISTVDIPAQAGAQITIMKRADDEFQKGVVLLSDVEGHAHVIDIHGFAGHSSWSGEGEDYHSHPWIYDVEENEIRIGSAKGHIHEAEFMSMMKAENGPKVVIDTSDSFSTAAKGGGQNLEANSMSDKNTADEKAATLQKRLDELEAGQKVLKSISELSPEHFAFYKGLTGEAAESFLGMDDSARNGEISKSLDSNPVIYTDSDGIEYRKNDDQRLVKAARRNDELEKQFAKSEALRKRAEFSKRAEDELGNLAGDNDTKVELLLLIDEHGSEDLQESMGEMLKGANEMAKGAFVRKGTKDGGSLEPSSAESELDTLATEYSKQNSVSFAKAYSAVLRTTKGAELYAKLNEGE